MSPFSAEKIGDILIPLSNPSPGLIVIIGNKDIEPIFKAGSLFIVDTQRQINHNNIIAIAAANEVLIRRIFIKEGQRLITTIIGDLAIAPLNDITHQVLGVVTRINAKT
jgi:Peptidase S24-like